MSKRRAGTDGAVVLDWLGRAWPWIVGLSGAAGMLLGRFLPARGLVTIIVGAWILGIAAMLATLAAWWRRAVGRVRRARPGALIIPGWAAVTTVSRLSDAPGPGSKPARMRAALIAVERGLELWRLDTFAAALGFSWTEVAGVEVRSHARGPFTSATLTIRLADGTDIGLQPLEPWAGGPAREPNDASEPTYADHLAARLRAARERPPQLDPLPNPEN